MPDHEPTAAEFQIAMGIAGHAIVVELLTALRIKGLLTEAECAKIIDNALVSIENLDRTEPTDVFRLARQLLEIQAQQWNPSGKTS